LVAAAGYVFGAVTFPKHTPIPDVARSIMMAASLLAGFVAASLVNHAGQVREARRQRISEFRECHALLRPLQEVFWALDVDLGNRFKIDFRYHMPLDELLRERDFFTKTEKPHLLMFKRCITVIGEDYFKNEGWAIGTRMLSFEEVHAIADAFERLSGTFSRRKYFGPLFEDPGYKRDADDEEVVVATWPAVKHKMEALKASHPDGWERMPFWEEQIERGYELSFRMRRIAFELEAHNPEGLANLSAIMLWLLLLCVALPLLIQVVPASEEVRRGLLGCGVATLLVGLMTAWAVVTKWAMRKRREDEGTLDV
jgi:hypothetical protein